MTRIDRKTGKNIDDLLHLRQSITDILTTRLLSRVMRPEYGSRLPDLVDDPLNSVTFLRIKAATVEAIAKNEPRIKIEKILTEAAPETGKVIICLYGLYLPTGREIALEGVSAQ
jgi:phage baseplate assembly protein W